MLKKTTIALTLGALLTGCGGGSTPSQGEENPPISGYVADGYLVGTLVCVDSNGDYSCSNEAITAITDAQGRYEFNISQIEAGLNIVAEISPETIDLDTNTPVGGDGYVLSGARDDSGFISPISTLIDLLDNDASTTRQEAIDMVATKLGVSVDDLGKDYVIKDTAAKILLHSIAMQVAEELKTLKTQNPVIEQSIDSFQEKALEMATTHDFDTSLDNVKAFMDLQKFNEVMDAVENTTTSQNSIATGTLATNYQYIIDYDETTGFPITSTASSNEFFKEYFAKNYETLYSKLASTELASELKTDTGLVYSDAFYSYYGEYPLDVAGRL